MSNSAFFRNSPRMIAADYLSDSLKIVLLVLAVVFSRSVPGTLLGNVLGWVGAVYLVVTLLEPPVRYLSHRYALTPEALVHHRGILTWSERSLDWGSVSSVEVEAPWATGCSVSPG